MLLYAAAGVAFGFLLSRSGAADYGFIQAMFLFESFQLYGIIGTAVALTAPGLGGMLFGVGWSMTGMCPGPIFVNIGEGKLYALAALAGALCGTALLGATYPRLRRPLGLPPVSVGTGEG